MSGEVCLLPMTVEMYHEYFKEYEKRSGSVYR